MVSKLTIRRNRSLRYQAVPERRHAEGLQELNSMAAQLQEVVSRFTF
jgi:hypothetical protein